MASKAGTLEASQVLNRTAKLIFTRFAFCSTGEKKMQAKKGRDERDPQDDQ
jgi:hypothetical protein